MLTKIEKYFDNFELTIGLVSSFASLDTLKKIKFFQQAKFNSKLVIIHWRITGNKLIFGDLLDVLVKCRRVARIFATRLAWLEIAQFLELWRQTWRRHGEEIWEVKFQSINIAIYFPNNKLGYNTILG